MSALGMRNLVLCGMLAACVTPQAPLSAPSSSSASPAARTAERRIAPDPPAVFDSVLFTERDTAFREAPEEGEGVCAVVQNQLDRDLAAVRALRPGAPSRAPTVAWDRRTPPRYQDLVQRRLRLREDERALLRRNGFVVLRRLEADSFAWQFHDVYQSQLPLYVSADAVLHAIYVTHDRLLQDAESASLAPGLSRAVDALHDALVREKDRYPLDTVRDLDLYLTVGRSLLREAPVPSRFRTDDEARALLAQIARAEGIPTVTLFGRERQMDFSVYRPRGHYAETEASSRYFRAAMWFSRVEFNLVSRSCRSSAPALDPSPTPREAADALTLADLAERAQVLDTLEGLDNAWEALAGRREDLSVHDILALRAADASLTPRAPDVAERLARAVGERFPRTARLHPMPEGASTLPAIATLLGPRVTADTEALRALVHTEVPERHQARVADVAYALGHDRAREHLREDLARYPALAPALDDARARLRVTPRDPSMYDAWLGALRGLSQRPEGALPSFTATEAFADLRVNSAVAGYAQLRHNYVLIAGQNYDEGGCAIPDAYVEPVPAVWDALIAYVNATLDGMEAFEAPSVAPTVAWLRRTREVLEALRTIAALELSGEPLPEVARRWLGMVVELRPGSSDGSPTYTGWYFDLFRQRAEEGLSDARLIADFHTSWWEHRITYAGTDRPAMGVFVVDTNGPPRVMVGPVASGYEHLGSTEQRLTDEESRALDPAQRARPWAAGYEATALPAPPLQIAWEVDPGRPSTVTLSSSRALGSVTLELLDHHRTRVRTLTAWVGSRPVRLTAPESVSAARVRVGRWDTVFSVRWTGGTYAFGAMAPAQRATDEDSAP